MLIFIISPDIRHVFIIIVFEENPRILIQHYITGVSIMRYSISLTITVHGLLHKGQHKTCTTNFQVSIVKTSIKT